MLAHTPIMVFVATAKPDDARRFYGEVLGLSLLSEDGFALVFEVNGTPLRVAKVEQLQPQGFTVLGWLVDDIQSMVQSLVGGGARFEIFEGFGQDEQGVWTAPGGAKIAWFKDPDGNTLSLTQVGHAE